MKLLFQAIAVTRFITKTVMQNQLKRLCHELSAHWQLESFNLRLIVPEYLF